MARPRCSWRDSRATGSRLPPDSSSTTARAEAWRWAGPTCWPRAGGTSVLRYSGTDLSAGISSAPGGQVLFLTVPLEGLVSPLAARVRAGNLPGARGPARHGPPGPWRRSLSARSGARQPVGRCHGPGPQAAGSRPAEPSLCGGPPASVLRQGRYRLRVWSRHRFGFRGVAVAARYWSASAPEPGSTAFRALTRMRRMSTVGRPFP